MGNTKNFVFIDNKLKGAGILNWVTDSSYVYDINFGKSQAEVNTDYQVFKNNFIKQSFSFTPSILEKNVSNTIVFTLFNYLVNETNVQDIGFTPVITLTYNDATISKNMSVNNKIWKYTLIDTIETDITYTITINNNTVQSGIIKTYKRIYYGSYYTAPVTSNYTTILNNMLSSSYTGPYNFSITSATTDNIYFWLLIPSEISLTSTSLQAVQGGMPRWTFITDGITQNISGYTIFRSNSLNKKSEISGYNNITVQI